MQPSQVRIGTSGWIYRHWRDTVYPPKTPQRRWFEFYSEQFDTVEINFSFYRLPSESTFRGWNERAPQNFCFAVKGSRYITHIKRLAEPVPSLELFFGRARFLASHLGPILWQLPPTFSRDDQRLEAFLAALPRGYRHTVEFRHESWNAPDIDDLLRSHDVARCIPDRRNNPGNLRLTASWTYLRFHQGRGRNGNYSSRQLEEWGNRIAAVRENGVEIWAYFNNDQFGFAVQNALELKRILDRPQSS